MAWHLCVLFRHRAIIWTSVSPVFIVGMVLYASPGFGESVTNTETQCVQDTISSSLTAHGGLDCHDDVMKWKHFPRYWPFVRGIHRSPVNSPHKGQWRGALMFSLIGAWIHGWVNDREASALRRHRAHYDVIVMMTASGAVRDVSIGIMATIVSMKRIEAEGKYISYIASSI